MQLAMSKDIVVIIGFNRPEHLQYCLQAVFQSQSLSEFDILFVLDGPIDSHKNTSWEQCSQLFETYLEKAKKLGLNADFLKRAKNVGLKENILSSIKEAAICHEVVVLLEDDIIVNKNFFNFILQYRALLADGSKYACLSGHVPFAFGETTAPTEAISHFYMNCWGWAGNTRCLEEVVFDPQKAAIIFDQIPNKRQFNFNNQGTSIWQLKANRVGKKSTWAIYWYLYLFSRGLKTIYPSRSLTLNIGNDGSGTNSGNKSPIDERLISEFIETPHQFLRTNDVKTDRDFETKYQTYIKSEKPGIFGKIMWRLKSLLLRIR